MTTAAREHSSAISQNRTALLRSQRYLMPEDYREDWMAPGRFPLGEMYCVQTNARKDGTLFKNMFYLKQVILDGHQCRLVCGRGPEVRRQLRQSVHLLGSWTGALPSRSFAVGRTLNGGDASRGCPEQHPRLPWTAALDRSVGNK